MKKSFFLLLILCFLGFFSQEAFAVNEQIETTSGNETVVEDTKDENVVAVEKFLEKYFKLQNLHNFFLLKNLYAEDFVNSDGFNLNQLFDLMKKTYANYPDLKSEFAIKNVIVNGNFATVYLSQNVSATTKKESVITGDKGEYTAQLEVVLYLEKVNKEWMIYSELVTYENSRLAFGSAKNVKATLNAPQKVLSGTDYCAGISVDVPAGYSAIASVNNTQVVEEQNAKEKTFRQVALENNKLERILKANNDNNNEAVLVSVGFTKVGQDMFKKPKVEISGLLMLMKRVDVIPLTSNFRIQNKEDKN